MLKKVATRVGVSFAIVAAILAVGSTIPLPGTFLEPALLEVRQFQVCSHGIAVLWMHCWSRYEVPSHRDLASAILGAAIIIFFMMWIWRRFSTDKTIKETED